MFCRRCDVESVAFNTPLHGRGPFPAIQAILPAGHIHAGGQPLQVPLPGTEGGLVKIVKVEDHVMLRRAIHAKVVDVRIAITSRPEFR